MKATTKVFLKKRIPRRLWKAMVECYRKLMRIRYRLKMLFLSGKMDYYCPCCGYKLDGFEAGDYLVVPDFYDISLFANVRQDILCPVCGSLPRHRILAKWCEDNKELLVDKDVLYFAPERGMTTWLKDNRISYKTADLYDEYTDLKLDIQSTGLPDDCYDVVICNHVLEHVGDYMTALNEIRRILRPEGVLICSFPMSPDIEFIDEDPAVVTDDDRLKRYGQSDHVRLFGMKAEELLAKSGMEITIIDGDDYPSEIVPVVGPCRYDMNRLFVCRNKAG